MTAFGVRLAAAKASRGPLCLGIDPHPELLRAWGLPTTADGLAAFCDICVEAFSGFAVVKPQVAFFESYGAAGYAVLERTIAALRDAAVLVLADAKRGDIGTTMAAYAAAWAGDSPLAVDAVTASPYLGFGSLPPRHTTVACSCWRQHPTRKARPCSGRPSTAARWPSWSSTRRLWSTGRPAGPPIQESPDLLVWSLGRRSSGRPMSARWADRCWCPGSACKAGGPRRLAVWVARRRASCCRRRRARCYEPVPVSRTL